MARHKLQIDPKIVEELAAIQCSYDEMGAVVGCSPDTLERRFAGAIEKGRARGRMSLKRKQFQRAMGGSDTMLIWLGKQYLGQTDKRDLVNHGTATVVEIDEETKSYLDQIIALSTPAGVKQ